MTLVWSDLKLCIKTIGDLSYYQVILTMGTEYRISFCSIGLQSMQDHNVANGNF